VWQECAQTFSHFLSAVAPVSEEKKTPISQMRIIETQGGQWEKVQKELNSCDVVALKLA
jgi:hypothetical protein